MTRKQIFITLGLGAISIVLGLAYIEFQKIKDYCISITKVKLKNFTLDNADIDLYLNFANKSKLNLSIVSQEYLVYINNSFVSKVSNAIPQSIKENSVSSLAVKLQFSPRQILNVLKVNAAILASSPQSVMVKISSNLKVGYGILKFNINYDYNTTLKELLTSEDPNSSAKKC